MSVRPGTFPVTVSRVGGDTPATIGATVTATRVVRYANRGPIGRVTAGDAADSSTLTILANGVEHADTLASAFRIHLELVGDHIIGHGTGDWDADSIREPGAPIEDQSIEDGGTGLWIWPYTGRNGQTSKIGAIFSTDGDTWITDPDDEDGLGPQNLIGTGQGEDPYIAKYRGMVWRDADGRAYMYAEEKDGANHRGIVAWRSAPGSLTVWEFMGRVLDRGATGAWDATDRTSPTVVVWPDGDGWLHTMLYEGRRDPGQPGGQEGLIGLATSSDPITGWVADTDPVIVGTTGEWDEMSLVPDDIYKVEDVWVVSSHGQDPDGNYTCGVHLTTDNPGEWTPESFVDHRANPITGLTASAMCWGTDTTHVGLDNTDRLFKARIVIDPPFVDPADVEAIQAKDDAQDVRLDDHEAGLDAHDGTLGQHATRLDTVEATSDVHENRLDTAEATILTHTSSIAAASTGILERALTYHDVDATAEADIDRTGQTPSDNTGMDISGFGQPDALDPSSDLTPPGLSFLAPDDVASQSVGAVWNFPPIPDGKLLVGVRVTNPAWADFTSDTGLAITLMDNTFQNRPGGASIEKDNLHQVFRGVGSVYIAGSDGASGDADEIVLVIEPTTDTGADGLLFIGLIGITENVPGRTFTADDVEWLFIDAPGALAALDQVDTNEVADDAITGPKVADGAIGSAHMAGQTIRAETGATALAAGDAWGLVTIDSASPADLTIPTNATWPAPIGIQVSIAQLGTGQVTVVATGGVTLRRTPTAKLRAQYSAATLIKIGTDTWLLAGDLAAS